jgi:hypothetical protein
MAELQRATTEYVAAEDRIRLSGALDGGATVVIWLTLRLLQRLLPPLVQWLEQRGGGVPRADVLHSFAQQKAQAGMAPSPPVQAAAESAAWLAASIDLARGDKAVRLTFKGQGGESAALTMTPTLLRQWLAILHAGYRRGGWPQDQWPGWIAENTAARPKAVVLH